MSRILERVFFNPWCKGTYLSWSEDTWDLTYFYFFIGCKFLPKELLVHEASVVSNIVRLHNEVILFCCESQIFFFSTWLIKELKEDRALSFNELNEVLLHVAEVIVAGVCVLTKDIKHQLDTFECLAIDCNWEGCLSLVILDNNIRNHVETLSWKTWSHFVSHHHTVLL